MAIAVYPGSFDPITFGHLDIATRAAKLFDVVHVVVVHNPNKSARFTSAERVTMVAELLKKEPGNYIVDSLDSGLLVDYCSSVKADVLVKGVRGTTDYEYELPMAQVNKDLIGIETIFLAANPVHGYVSSSLVKQVAELGGDISKYVPDSVAEKLRG